MQASAILTNVAVILLAATIWNDLKERDSVTIARKTWLLVACLFALISAILQLWL